MPPDQAAAGAETRGPSYFLSLRSRRSNRYLADALKQPRQQEEPAMPGPQYAPQPLLQSLQQPLASKSSKRSLRQIFSRSKLSKDKAAPPATVQDAPKPALCPPPTATTDNDNLSSLHDPPLAEPALNSSVAEKRASSVPRSRPLRRQSRAVTPAVPGRKASIQENASHESLAAWEMPQLFKAFPQTIRQATLPAVTMSTEMVLRLHEKNTSAAAAAEQLTMEERNSKEKAKKKHGKNPSLSNLQWTTKIYLLTTSGHLLQYSGAGNFDRLPEKVLKLSNTSAAFVTDSIPGKHWVLQISSSTEPDTIIPSNEPKSILSKLSILTGEKRETANILMVFESPVDLDSWMATLRGEIEKLGGKRKLSETGVPERPAAPRQAPRTIVVRDSMRFSSTSPSLQGSSSDCDLTLKVGDSHHIREQSLDEVSTTNSVVSQDGRQLDSLRDSNGNRLSFASADRRTAVTSAASSPERSPIADGFPRDSTETCDSREYNNGSKKADPKLRPNASVIASRRSTMQNAGLFIDVSADNRSSQSEEDPFLAMANETLESPTGLVAPNFSVPQSSKRRFSHVRINSSNSQSPPSPNTLTFASRSLRSKPPLALRSSRPLSMVADHQSPKPELPARPPTADGTSRQGLSPVKEQAREQRQRHSRRHSPRSSADGKPDKTSPRSSLAISDGITSPSPSYRISPRRARPPLAGMRRNSPDFATRTIGASKRLSTVAHEPLTLPISSWNRTISRRQSTMGSIPAEVPAPQQEMRRASLHTSFTPLGHRRHSSSHENRPASILPPMPPPPSGPLPALPDVATSPKTDKERALLNRRSMPQVMPPPVPPPLRELPPLPNCIPAAMSLSRSLVVVFAAAAAAADMACPGPAPNSSPRTANGVSWKLLTNQISQPRQLVQDTLGNILMAEGKGLRRLELDNAEGMDLCVKTSTQLVVDETLNHGIALTADGKTLFASSSTDVYAYTYDAATGVAGPARNVITGMNQTGHVTRTLYIPPGNPDLLLVTRGSNDNVDPGTADMSSGRSQLRVFRVAELVDGKHAVDYTAGDVMGWGMRNSVGMGQDPTTGNIWSVENSLDDMKRLGDDIHNSNPGEEMNFHGRPNDTAGYHYGRNFGYPGCLNRQPPNGYRLSRVSFANGNPVKRSHQGDAEEMLMWNADNADCEKHCFRPAGLLLDKQGRLFMTSDATGELFLVMGVQNKGVTANQ
ncbi:hypothetical protein LLEC1_04855 [Akanthomyces lecanii]|uniref:Pyrroloquinoline quinone-dependent pyranose dehydrogenase beta-propeller domain-containing protein n=1 Tax=Cordyceps confragosa TaxID=2714763 RepID=A0A179I958_CORDF|nr:hypothetical protein LLEC1_04855 [Akanthomyces lecanii]